MLLTALHEANADGLGVGPCWCDSHALERSDMETQGLSELSFGFLYGASIVG